MTREKAACCADLNLPGSALFAGLFGRSCFDAFTNGLESDKIVGMTAPVASKIFADRIGRIEVSATMAVTAEAARLRARAPNSSILARGASFRDPAPH